jgi:hypothetical protein
MFFCLPNTTIAQKKSFDSMCFFCDSMGVRNCGKWVGFHQTTIRKRLLKKDVELLRKVQAYLQNNDTVFRHGLPADRYDDDGVIVRDGDSARWDVKLYGNYFEIDVHTAKIKDSVIKAAMITRSRTAYCNAPGDNPYFDTRILRILISKHLILPYFYSDCSVLWINAYPDYFELRSIYKWKKIDESFSSWEYPKKR